MLESCDGNAAVWCPNEPTEPHAPLGGLLRDKGQDVAVEASNLGAGTDGPVRANNEGEKYTIYSRQNQNISQVKKKPKHR